MINLDRLKIGDKLSLTDGSIVIVKGEDGDNLWVLCSDEEGEERWVFCEEVVDQI